MKFICVRVWVDITKPLKRGFFLRRPGEEDLWVKFRNEGLSDFCYSCGRVGHNFNECKNKDESKENPVYDGNLRAEISWLDTINFGDKEPTKLVYPVSKKRSSRGGDDGGAAYSPAGMSSSDIGSVGNRTKDVGLLSADVGSPQELIHPDAIQVSLSPKSASGLGSQSPMGTQTSGQLEYFVVEPDSPSSLQRALVGLESDKPISPRLPKILLWARLRDVDSALIVLPPSTLVISPPNFSLAKLNSSKSSKGRYVKGGEGIRHSPRRKGVPLSRLFHLDGWR
ncbi:hypothetical protein C3L33_13882, partial [Rhododendron williamsianum]